MGIPADQMMAMLQGAYEPEPADQDRINALRRQQALGVLGQMGGANVGQFGQALYSGAGGELEQMAEQRQAASGQTGKRLDLAMKMMDYNEKVREAQMAAGVGEYDYSKPPPDFGKLSEQQQKQYKFGKESAQAIGKMVKQGDFEPNLADRQFLMSGGEGVLGTAAAYAASPEGRSYMNAARNAVANIVYGKSGAQVTESEWQRAVPVYVPMPWDSPEERRQKITNLKNQALTMAEVTGPASKWLRGYMEHQWDVAPAKAAEQPQGTTPDDAIKLD